MRVCVLGQGVFGTGAISVARNLITSMIDQGAGHRFSLFTSSRLDLDDLRSERVEIVRCRLQRRYLRRWLHEAAVIPRRVAACRPDVLLALGDRGLIRPPCPQAILLHRAQMFYPARYYSMYSWPRRALFAYHAQHLRRALPRTPLLLCQTPVAARRVRQVYGYRGQIAICPNAVSTEIGGDGPVPAAVRAQAGKLKLLYVSSYNPHKNLEGLLDLFDRYRADLSGVVVFVTIAPSSAPARRFLGALEARGLSSQIVNVGAVPQAALGAYYRSCDALFFPTFLESSSAAYLEAMHFDLPVLTSDLDFARYACGDAALYFDPWSPASMKAALDHFRGDPSLAAALVERGRAQREALSTTWDRIAADLLEALEALVTGDA